MKRTHTSCIAGLAVGLALPALAFAGGDKGAHRDPVMNEVKLMDTNDDGKLTPEEHAAGARKMFETMDGNKDGKVTAAEMEAAHETMAAAKHKKSSMTAEDKIKVVDGNADGELTAEEHAAGARAMFEKMDGDKDGSLSKRELKAGHKKMLHKPAQ